MVVDLKSVDEIRTRIENTQEECVELDARNFGLRDDGYRFAELDFALDENATKAAFQTIKAPSGFLKDCHDFDLISNIIGYCTQKLEKPIIYGRVQGRKHLSKTYSHKTPTVLEIFDAVIACREDWQIERFAMNGTATIGFISRIAAEPPRRVGDASHGGVLIELGERLKISEYIVTLRCGNGMLGPRTRELFASDADAGIVPPAVKRAVRMAIVNVEQKFLPQFISTDEVLVTNPERILHHLASHVLPSELEKQLLSAIRTIPEDGTYYDLIDAVTRFGRDAWEVSPQVGRQVAVFANRIVAAAERERCNQCQRPLR